MPIVSSCCNICDCYTVACDKCGTHANKCGNYDIGQAAERARIAGYTTIMTTASQPATWLCKQCTANRKISDL